MHAICSLSSGSFAPPRTVGRCTPCTGCSCPATARWRLRMNAGVVPSCARCCLLSGRRDDDLTFTNTGLLTRRDTPAFKQEVCKRTVLKVPRCRDPYGDPLPSGSILGQRSSCSASNTSQEGWLVHLYGRRAHRFLGELVKIYTHLMQTDGVNGLRSKVRAKTVVDPKTTLEPTFTPML